MVVKIETFSGTQPTIQNRRLAPNVAELAHNTRLIDGSLRSYRQSSTVHQFPFAIDTFLKTEAGWEGYAGNVSVVSGPTATDRLYIAGDGVPKVRDANGTDPLALYAPTTAPLAAVIDSFDVDTAFTVAYAVTFVTVRDEESPPSPLSAFITTDAVARVQIDALPNAPMGRSIDRIRIYRAETDTLGTTSLFFVADVSVNAITYTHDPVAVPSNEQIETATYDPPPDTLDGLTAMQNGIIAGFSGRELLFSEPYRPHAWPEAYRLFTDYEIVGLAAFGSMLAVLTTGTPYRVQGTTPDSMRMEQIEQNAPCLSRRGIVDMGYAAAYPSTNGLMLIMSDGAQLVSGPIFDRDLWQALKPGTIVAAEHEGQYLYTHEIDVNGNRAGGVFDLSGEAPFHTTLDLNASAMWHDIETGQTYVLKNDQEVQLFDDFDEAPIAYKWISKTFSQPWKRTYGAFRIEADADHGQPVSGVKVSVYADGQLIHTKEGALPNTPHRLPSGTRAYDWKVMVEGTMRVSSFRMASSYRDLIQAG